MYSVRSVPSLVGRDFIVAHHYTRGCHNRPTCFGLFHGEDMIGVVAFATPCSENVRRSVLGPEHKGEVTELHRLVILDDAPRIVATDRRGRQVDNTATWFVSRALKAIKHRAVISFSDRTQGHTGGVYRALGFTHAGTTPPSRFYLDETGRLRHPRQCGVNITLAEAAARGWTPVMRQAKDRWLWFRDKGARALYNERRFA
jgi:hypothetical protein